MAINKKLIVQEAAAAVDDNAGEEGLVLHLDANDVDSYDGDGDVWYDIKDHEYTPTTDVSEHFNTVIYDGTSSTNSISSVGFEPDLVWIKKRSGGVARDHMLYDSVRGAGYRLRANQNYTNSYASDELTSFDDDGFTLSTSDAVNGSGSSAKYVAWCFKAGGEPSGSDKVSIDGVSYADEAAAGLTAGTLAVDKLSANTKLGFSMVKVVDHNNTKTIAHGLDSAPEMIIVKVLDSAYSWYVYHKDLGNDKYINLNTTSAAATDNFWDYTSPTGSVFTHRFSTTSLDMIAYCFTSKRGVSKVGSYTGTGAVGNYVNTGFEPAFVMVKRTNGTGGNWMMHDNKRSANNGDGQDLVLYADLNSSEDEYSSGGVVFNSNGFTLNVVPTSTNLNGGKYIYYAVAKNTNETSLIPDTDLELHLDADSFDGSTNTPTTWTDSSSNSNNGTITGALFDGELGNWLDFDGSSNKVKGSISGIGSQFTVEFWVSPNDFTGNENLFELYNSATNNSNNRIFFSGGALYASKNGGDDGFAQKTSISSVMTIGKWHHVVAKYDGSSSIKLYVDTVKIAENLSVSGTFDIANFAIGVNDAMTAGERNFGNAKIGQVRVYNTILTDAQIRQNYNFTKPSYPNGNDGTISGATWNSGGYFVFDGTNDSVLLPQLSPSDIKTVSFWIKSSDTSANRQIFSMGSSSQYNWLNIRLNSGKIEAGLGSDNGGYMSQSAITTSSSYNTGDWTHVVCLFTGVYGTNQTPNIYVNNVDVASSIISEGYFGAQPTTGSGAIGYYFAQNTLYINAQISNFKIYDEVLTTSEIEALYNAGH